MNTQLSGRFGIYPWFPGDDEALIAEADVGAFRDLLPNGKVFYCAGIEGDRLVLKYGEKVFRVSPILFREVKTVVRAVGSTVRLADGSLATVADVMWHFARGEPMYLLILSGKKKSRRYWNSDLCDATQEDPRM